MKYWVGLQGALFKRHRTGIPFHLLSAWNVDRCLELLQPSCYHEARNMKT